MKEYDQARQWHACFVSQRAAWGRVPGGWVRTIGLDPAAYGTHTMRRTTPSLIYRRTKTCARFSYCWVTRKCLEKIKGRPCRAISGQKRSSTWSASSEVKESP